jgi:hypothetical protein
MSDDILVAAQYRRDYLQSYVDDLFSFYYTMQWAAVFTIRSSLLKIFLWISKYCARTFWELERIDLSPPNEVLFFKFSPREYGSILADYQPVLRDWYVELQSLKADWKNCQLEQKGKKTNAEIYIPLFSTLALLKGVATLAEVVYRHTTDMD